MKRILAVTALILTLAATSAAAQSVRDCGKGLVDKAHAPSAVPLLSRFDFQYGKFGDEEDHHIQQILIHPNFQPGTMRVGFHDQNKDDRYCFEVVHINVSDSRIQSSSRALDICSDRGKCTARLNKPAGDFVFVLIGFQLS